MESFGRQRRVKLAQRTAGTDGVVGTGVEGDNMK